MELDAQTDPETSSGRHKIKMYDVIIIGSGPAGLTAAIYATRANLKTFVIAGGKWGGQLMLTTLVENYPGFPEGIYGPDLMMNMRKQAEKHGAEIVEKDFTKGEFNPPAGGSFKVTAGDSVYEGKAVIVATGADTKWLGVPGEQEKIGRGVSSCAPCDGAFFRGKNVIVVGGGDAAMEEALFLTKFATSVTMIHRREEFRASKIMQDRVKANKTIKFIFNTEIKEILGGERVTSVKLFNSKTSQTSEMPIDGVFVAIGHIPNSAVFEGIETDPEGYIKVHEHYKTNREGIFVAGDVHDNHYRQAVTAAGYGCAAALEVERWLSVQQT